MKKRITHLCLYLACIIYFTSSLAGFGLWVEPYLGLESGQLKQGFSLAGEDLLSSTRELKFSTKPLSLGGALGIHHSLFLFGVMGHFYNVEYKTDNLLYHKNSEIKLIYQFGVIAGFYIPATPLRVSATFNASQFNLDNWDGKEGGINYYGSGFSIGLGYFFPLIPNLLKVGLNVSYRYDAINQAKGIIYSNKADLPVVAGISEIKRYDKVSIQHVTISINVPLTI